MSRKLKTEKVRGKNGGARPGSGRKPVKMFEAREMFKAAFDRNFTQRDWDEFIDKAKHDPKLLTYIIDQRIGKAAQAVDITSKGEALNKLVMDI